jgi:hypothetical protein
MKKIYWAFILIITLVNVSYAAEVNKFLVESNKQETNTNDVFYISAFASDAQWAQVSWLDPKFIVENDAIKVWKFYSCASAEWRELCWKYDSSFIGLQWVYVAKAQTTDKVWDFNITVFSDENKTNSWSVKISVKWEAKSDIVTNENTSLNDWPVTWAWINGKEYIYLWIFLLSILLFYWISNNKKRVHKIGAKI